MWPQICPLEPIRWSRFEKRQHLGGQSIAQPTAMFFFYLKRPANCKSVRDRLAPSETGQSKGCKPLQSVSRVDGRQLFPCRRNGRFARDPGGILSASEDVFEYFSSGTQSSLPSGWVCRE